MELNVFTQQLEQCYNILSQQFIIIKQLKDLTLGSTNQGSAINELKQKLSALNECKLYKHKIATNLYTFFADNDRDVNVTIEVLSSRKEPYENLQQLANDTVILIPQNITSYFDGVSTEDYQYILFSLYKNNNETWVLGYDYLNNETMFGYLQIDIFNDDVTIY